jgi:hypothetical protein
MTFCNPLFVIPFCVVKNEKERKKPAKRGVARDGYTQAYRFLPG